MRTRRPASPRLPAVLRSVAATALASWAIATQAVGISPVLVELSAARRIVSITVTNPDDQPITFQAATRRWWLDAGVDRYEDTDELAVVPAIATIAPKGTQIFRVTLRAAPPAEERAFRLVLEDVGEASAQSDDVGLQVRVNHDLPVFANAPGRPVAQPRIEPCAATPPGRLCVRVTNDGDRWLQVRRIVAERGSARADVAAASRVLVGGWREFAFDPLPGAGPTRVTAETPVGPITLELP